MLSTIVFLSTALLPCRYTVRDVAFVDLGDPPYRLVTYVAEENGRLMREDLLRLTTAVLADSNVEGCLLDPDEPLDDPDALRLSSHRVQEFPFTALVSPLGEELILPWGAVERNASTTASRMLDSVLRSPSREEICDGLIESYCVVVLVEGLRAAENEAAHAVVAGAFAELATIFDSMPKDVGESPQCVVVEPCDYDREQVLLWSLGLEDPGREGPTIAVLFGRGRRIGPLLRGDALAVSSLFRILATVGLDCECDLDRSWMRGPRIPLRWDSSMRQRAVSALGFDPDSPRVRSEVSSILAHSSSGAATPPRLARTLDELILAYREEPVVSASRVPPSPASALGSVEAHTPEPRQQTGTALKSLLIAFSAIAGLSVICSVAVLLKARPQ